MFTGKRRIIAVNLTLVLVLAGTGWWGYSLIKTEAPIQVTATTKVSVGDVVATISASGKVISPGDVAVNPSINGTLTSIKVKVGDRVKAGQILAQLDSSSQRTALTQANSAVQTAKANKAKLKRVRTAAETAQVNLQIAQANSAISNAQKNLDDQSVTLAANSLTYQNNVDTAKTALDNAKSLSELNKVTYQSSVDSAKNSMDAGKVTFDRAQLTYSSYQALYPSATYEWCTQYAISGNPCNTVINYFNALENARNSLANLTLSHSNALNTQKINLAKDEQNISNLQSSYEAALKTQSNNLKKDEQTLASLKNSVTAAQTSHDLLQAQLAVAIQPATEAEIATADAQLATANANYVQSQRNLAATTIKAPVAGDVASISNSVGQTVSTGGNSNNNNNDDNNQNIL